MINNVLSGETATGTTSKGKVNFIIPKGQINLAALSLRIGTGWSANQASSTFTFISRADFEAKATQFDTDVRKKREQLAKRKILTAEMNATMTGIKTSLRHLKAYIVEKYGATDAKSHFADFGIVMSKKSYGFPTDRDALLVSLGQTVSSLNNTPDIAGRTFGLTFWSGLKDKLASQWNEAAITDGSLGVLTAAIHNQTEEMSVLVHRMKNQIKLDNPKTYLQIWRSWGIQSEKF